MLRYRKLVPYPVFETGPVGLQPSVQPFTPARDKILARRGRLELPPIGLEPIMLPLTLATRSGLG